MVSNQLFTFSFQNISKNVVDLLHNWSVVTDFDVWR